MDNLDIPALILIVGAQGLGKSHLIRYLMNKMRKKFDYGLVFTNTFFDDNPFDYIDAEYVHPEYDEDKLQNLMDIQAKLIEKGVKKNAFVIFDDCIDDPNQFNSPVLKRLCTQLRHYNITVIFSTQYCNALPSRMRTNAMSVFMFYTDTKNNLEALYNSFGQSFETYNDFKSFLLSHTGNYKFIYFNKMKSNNQKDNYIVMKCPPKINKFKIKFNNKI